MSTKKLDDLGISAFCESMAMMAHAGIHTDEALRLLTESEGYNGVLEHALVMMRDKVDEGSSLTNAMKDTGIFPEYALKMVEAGENFGRLEDVMFKLSRYYADQKTISDKLKNAVTYPAVMLVMIIAVLAVMISMVLPAFTKVYNNLTGSLTASSYSYVTWAYRFCTIALVVMIIIAACLFIGLIMFNGSGRKTVISLLMKIPVCKDIIESMGKYRFTAALSIFLASGEMQDMAVLDGINMVDCESVEKLLKDSVVHMEDGHSFAQSAYNVGLFEPVYGRMLLAGERSGELENVLDRLTGVLEDNCRNLVDRLIGIVDPLLSGFMMVSVGMALISVMLPLIGMMNSIV